MIFSKIRNFFQSTISNKLKQLLKFEKSNNFEYFQRKHIFPHWTPRSTLPPFPCPSSSCFSIYWCLSADSMNQNAMNISQRKIRLRLQPMPNTISYADRWRSVLTATRILTRFSGLLEASKATRVLSSKLGQLSSRCNIRRNWTQVHSNSNESPAVEVSLRMKGKER